MTTQLWPQKPRNFLESGLVARADRALVKAQKRGSVAHFKVYRARDLDLLVSRGWEVETYTPVSYGAPETWRLRH